VNSVNFKFFIIFRSIPRFGRGRSEAVPSDTHSLSQFTNYVYTYFHLFLPSQ
jgi:hypothetical protein